ncbi:uncharacterized protein LOC113972965 [Neopelma chrysocephalum]|uniref:uncharacterized protein LOC113972965 n=1 Tax=Neopelma chrysocephalum TaxID=114329 RepID=UPI000FCD1C45|nr:uncharacterized protein LOC113972965 [Neopelma chrysocephalum]
MGWPRSAGGKSVPAWWGWSRACPGTGRILGLAVSRGLCPGPGESRSAARPRLPCRRLGTSSAVAGLPRRLASGRISPIPGLNPVLKAYGTLPPARARYRGGDEAESGEMPLPPGPGSIPPEAGREREAGRPAQPRNRSTFRRRARGCRGCSRPCGWSSALGRATHCASRIVRRDARGNGNCGFRLCRDELSLGWASFGLAIGN